MFGRRLLGMVLLAGMLIGQAVPRVQAAASCDHAEFISDLSAPDGSSFTPGAPFTKTWRFKNAGTCPWTTSYSVVFLGGDGMSAPASVKLPVTVAPGQMIDISVNLTAPGSAGQYKGLWKFSNASGAQFGIGATGMDAFWVDINVVENKSVIYDFVANAPYAQWRSGAGPLPFPGASGDYRGYSLILTNPHLEDDSYDSAPGLLTVPQNKYNGYIQAVYPEIELQQDDTLQTLVNCEFGATGCYVTFRIDYITSTGAQKTLWSWKEAYEKRFYRASIDLSPLAGQKVRFVFLLLSSGFANRDRAIWGSPRILRTGATQPPAPPPTLTLLPPLTPTTTPILPPPPVQPSGCDRASFVTDVTIPDGTVFTPGSAFTKTWRLRNSGSCTWTTAYRLMYFSGEQMSAPTAINLPWSVAPNQTVDLTVNMAAPAAAGTHRGYWILGNANGQLFGISADASKPFWVEIHVSGEAPYEAGYNFWLNACSAEWRSGSGPLPCPGMEGDNKGFIIPQNFSHLEDGTMGPAPALLIAPENKYNSYLQGIFPALTVQPGDRFRSVVGCEYGFSCYVTFRLDYMTPNGGIFNFWTWREQSDRKNYSVDLDLSPLAGRSVRFILTILATGSSSGDRVRWGSPALIRLGSAPPATPTLSPTVTPTGTPPAGMPGTVVPSPLIRRLHMIDALNGWAISDSHVLRTIDGGVTWYNVAMPGMTSIGGGFFQSINKGWVIAATAEAGTSALFRTNDGGFTWVRNDVPFTGGYLQFMDDTHGVVLQILDSAMNKQSVALYQTVDGGATWTRNYINDPTISGSSNSLPLSGHKNGMTFRDPLTGWVGGDIPMNGFTYLYKTTDGGITWAQQVLALPPGYESAFVTIEAPIFFSANDAILPVWMSTNTGRDVFVYVTRDGGGTWTRSPGAAARGWSTDFVSMNDGFSWSLNGFFQTTHDSGATWSQVTSNVNFGDDLPQIDFVSPTTGWARQNPVNGSTPLYRTNDGGATWTLVSGPAALPTPTPTPSPVPTFTPSVTPAAPIGPYAVVNVSESDVLNIRSGAGVANPIIGYYPPDATDVMRTGSSTTVDGAAWVEVRRGDGLTGWVNSYYLTEYVTHDAFCADARILPILEQVRQSMNQSDGGLLAPWVSPIHGVNMHLWAYGPGINFTQASAATLYTNTTVHNWGGGPSGIPDTGTFNQVVKPKYLDVLNAPNRETYCDDYSKVFPLSRPWPYPNVRFYNLYKPASDLFFDFRTLLIGFEYINGQPYLYGFVTIIWEP